MVKTVFRVCYITWKVSEKSETVKFPICELSNGNSKARNFRQLVHTSQSFPVLRKLRKMLFHSLLEISEYSSRHFGPNGKRPLLPDTSTLLLATMRHLQTESRSGTLGAKSPVHTRPKEFENGGFTLNTHQLFSVQTTREEFKNATITAVILELWLKKTRTGKSQCYPDVIVFEKLRCQNVFCPVLKRKAGVCSKFFRYGWKKVFEKLRFRDGFGLA